MGLSERELHELQRIATEHDLPAGAARDGLAALLAEVIRLQVALLDIMENSHSGYAESVARAALKD